MYIKLIKPYKKNLYYNIIAYNTEDKNLNFGCFSDTGTVNHGCSSDGSNSGNSGNQNVNFGCIGNADAEYNSNYEIVNFSCINSSLFPEGSINFSCL